jgi:fatty acid desaturase
MATTCDTTTDLTGIFSFMFFAGFNIHSVHHMFPTADHSQFPKILPYII